jgi:ribonuclease HI
LEIKIYTDGSSLGNPGPGGYGIVLISGKFYKEISAGYRLTTNNRMELLAAIVALETLKKKGSKVRLFSDSKYVIDAINKKWVFNWQKKGFKGKKNPDLWKRFLAIYPKHEVEFIWVKGHAGNQMNEKCDELAVDAANSSNLLIDEAYEIENKK